MVARPASRVRGDRRRRGPRRRRLRHHRRHRAQRADRGRLRPRPHRGGARGPARSLLHGERRPRRGRCRSGPRPRHRGRRRRRGRQREHGRGAGAADPARRRSALAPPLQGLGHVGRGDRHADLARPLRRRSGLSRQRPDGPCGRAPARDAAAERHARGGRRRLPRSVPRLPDSRSRPRPAHRRGGRGRLPALQPRRRRDRGVGRDASPRTPVPGHRHQRRRRRGHRQPDGEHRDLGLFRPVDGEPRADHRCGDRQPLPLRRLLAAQSRRPLSRPRRRGHALRRRHPALRSRQPRLRGRWRAPGRLGPSRSPASSASASGTRP